MAKTFQDLEREVAGLRRQIRRLEGNPSTANQQAVDEIMGTADEDPSFRTLGAGLEDDENQIVREVRSR